MNDFSDFTTVPMFTLKFRLAYRTVIKVASNICFNDYSEYVINVLCPLYFYALNVMK